MDDFEQLLRDSLRRKDAPAGFERRVLSAASRQIVSWRPIAAIAAALTLTAGIGGWQYEQQRRERAAGEAAVAKLEIALRVTSSKLHKVHQTLDSINQGF